MSEETLLNKAILNYNASIILFREAAEDEGYTNLAGYHLQQSVEMALKYQLEQYGVEYPKTHDVDQLIRIGKEKGLNLHLTEYMEEHSEMFSLWEAKTRYILNYRLEYTKVERAISEVGRYLDILIAGNR